MRKHWKEFQIEDIIEDLFDGPHATPKPSKNGPVFLGVKNLSENGRIDLSQIKHIAEKDFSRWTKRVVPKNDDIVFIYEASLHRYGLLKDNLRCCLGRRMALLRLDKTKVNPQFLLYYFLSSEWRQTIEQNIIVGATVHRIPISDFPSFRLSLPGLEEQGQIATILADIDAKIDLNNRINAELESLARTIYDYWFLQFDFPDEAGRPYRSSGGAMNQDNLPIGWSKGNIMELANLLGGGTPNKKKVEYWGGDIPFFTPTDAKEDVYSYETASYTTSEGIANCSSKLFEPNTIFITARGSVGRLAIAGQSMGMNQSCYALKAKEGVSTSYLYFKTQELIEHLKVKSSGSVFNSIVSNDIEWTIFSIPDIEAIQAFAKVVDPMFKQIANLTLENRHLSSLRDWLLPLLMSGEVVVGE